MKKHSGEMESLTKLIEPVKKYKEEKGQIGKWARGILKIYCRILKAEREKEKTMEMLSKLSRHSGGS